MPLRSPSACTVRSTSADASADPAASRPAGYAWIQPTAKPSPGGRCRSESVNCMTVPSRTTAIAFISVPSTNCSTITSPRCERASVVSNFASRSSALSSRKTPRWPPESAGLITFGKPTWATVSRASSIVRATPNRGCGMPAASSRRRISILFVKPSATSTPIPGSPSASATEATATTARSEVMVSTPSGWSCFANSIACGMSTKFTTSPMSASPSASAFGLPSIAATRRPSSFAWRIAARWCRPAPRKRTVFTAATIASRASAACRPPAPRPVANRARATARGRDGGAPAPGLAAARPRRSDPLRRS